MSGDERFRKIDERLDRLERGVCLLERAIATHGKAALGMQATREDYESMRELGRLVGDLRFMTPIGEPRA